MDETVIKTGIDPTWKTIYTLRDLTRRTGLLHEVQVKNLRMWPLVIVEAVKSDCEFDYDAKLVTFKVKLPEPKASDIQERCKRLDECVKALLGNEYAVLVRAAGRKLYMGPPKHEPGTDKISK